MKKRKPNAAEFFDVKVSAQNALVMTNKITNGGLTLKCKNHGIKSRAEAAVGALITRRKKEKDGKGGRSARKKEGKGQDGRGCGKFKIE